MPQYRDVSYEFRIKFLRGLDQIWWEFLVRKLLDYL
jgi:hypothetical protein